jgi:dipeptidyl aminopeptidase/acylaminoacyl peptidase
LSAADRAVVGGFVGGPYATAACVAIALGAFLDARPVGANDDVDLFASASRFALPALSPDGARLSYVHQADGRQYVVLRTLSSGAERRTLSVDPARERVRWCDWAGPRFVLCGAAVRVRAPQGVGEHTRLYSIEAGGAVRELNARLEDPIRDHVIDLIHSHPTNVLLQHDPVGRGFPEVAELDVATGALRRVVQSRPPVTRWMSDGHGAVRLGLAYERGTSSLFVRAAEREEWKLLLEQPATDLAAIAPLAIGAGGQLYVLKHHEGRAALFRSSLSDSKPERDELLFAHPYFDVTGPATLDPRTGAATAVAFVAEQEAVHTFDDHERRRRGWLDQRLRGSVNSIIDRSEDGRVLLVRSGTDVDPPSLFLARPEGGTLDLIGHEYPQLEERPMAGMRPVSYRARDGQKIPAYLSTPAVDRPLPAVVLPHGGPEARDARGFDPLVQFLAAEGYAVLQMNYRGSLGYGAGFAAAGSGQWGGVIHNDITDGARWLIEEGIADPARVCIVGASFGGYAAMLGAARESQWYACAASFAGVSDLMALRRHADRLQGAWSERLPHSTRALWQMSPLARVRAVETPVLLVHGRWDPIAPVSQSRRFARALDKAGKPYAYIERDDCDHQMTIRSCRRVFYAELQRFLHAYLGDGGG